jgi:opacity protein-like surface antigen
MFSSRLALALVVAALCPGGRAAHAQAAPVSYWMPSGPVGFGGNLMFGQSSNAYGNFAGFNGSDAGGGGFALTRYNFSDGWFVGSGGGSIGLGMNGISQAGAFGNIGSLDYQGVQFGYNFQNAHSLPITVYAGFDTFKYYTGIGGALNSFSAMSNTVPGYGAHAGIEFKPTQNLSLSLGVGYTQQSAAYSAAPSDINSSLMPAASLMATSGRR